VKKFPHLVQMHRTHAADGLVCMSLNAVDTEPADRERALTFLKEQGATFPNFILVDSEANEERYGEQYPTGAPPTVILFDRKGNRVKVLDSPEEHEVEAEVKRLLAEK
jgi:hypothetical protein